MEYVSQVTIQGFEESVRNCFGPSEYEVPNGALSKLLQLGTVKDYQREFEKLMNRATDIPNSLLISFYIYGLKLHLQREFLVSRPITLGPVTPTENEDAIESGDTSILNSLFGHESPRSLQLLGTVGTGVISYRLVLSLVCSLRASDSRFKNNNNVHRYCSPYYSRYCSSGTIHGVYQESWIFAITEYFSLQNTPADQWLKIVGFNLEGAAAEWFQWMTKNGLITTWTRFEESVRNCFGPSEYEDPNGALSKLLQLGTVKDYQREFEKLMNRATDIPDSLLISFYISGLKLHLQREFLVSRPTTLGDAFSLSLITEARLDDQAALVAGTMTKTFGNNGGDESESSGPVTPTENEDAIESGDTSILNSLFGHESPRSLQLLGTVGTGKVHILIDNDSTHNFVQPGVVERMKLPVKNTKLFKVYIGNVETLLCKNLCAQVTLETYCVKTYLFLERLNAKYINSSVLKGAPWLRKGVAKA
ncbi:ty3-gypsy retrotransposon protein [Tanacetum coccineum]